MQYWRTLIAGAAVSLAVPAVAVAQDAETTTTLNIRAGPGSEFPVVAAIPAGGDVTVYGCLNGYNWCDVSWRGNRGWVYAAYLAYPYDGREVVIADYGTYIGLPIIGFSVAAYWDDHYHDRPWYRDRHRWIGISFDDDDDDRDRRRRADRDDDDRDRDRRRARLDDDDRRIDRDRVRERRADLDDDDRRIDRDRVRERRADLGDDDRRIDRDRVRERRADLGDRSREARRADRGDREGPRVRTREGRSGGMDAGPRFSDRSGGPRPRLGDSGRGGGSSGGPRQGMMRGGGDGGPGGGGRSGGGPRIEGGRRG